MKDEGGLRKWEKRDGWGGGLRKRDKRDSREDVQ